MDVKIKMSDPAEVFKSALSLDVHDRAALAQGLLASLEELSEEEAERLWAEEAQRRLEEYRAGRAKAVRAEEVMKKADRLFRLRPLGTTRPPRTGCSMKSATSNFELMGSDDVSSLRYGGLRT